MAWPARVRGACVAALVLAAAMPLAAAPPAHAALDDTAAAVWPRVFYAPQQRAAIEHARRQPPGAAAAADAQEPAGQHTAQSDAAAPDEPASLVLQGTTRGRHGATAWINGQTLQQGESYAGRRVHILDDGRVRLSRAGAPDLVLLPGQQASTDGGERHDVLPPGAVLETHAPKSSGFDEKAPFARIQQAR